MVRGQTGAGLQSPGYNRVPARQKSLCTMLRLESTFPPPPTPVDVKPTNPRTSRLGTVAWPSGSESPACPVAALWPHRPSPRRSSLLIVIPQVWNGTCNVPLIVPSKEHHPPSLSHYTKATPHCLADWTLRFTCVSQTGCNIHIPHTSVPSMFKALGSTPNNTRK